MKQGTIKDIKIPVKVVLGETELSVAEIAELTPGKIIALNSIAGEPVKLMAAGETIAHCEVVVIDEMFGVRITNLREEE